MSEGRTLVRLRFAILRLFGPFFCLLYHVNYAANIFRVYVDFASPSIENCNHSLPWVAHLYVSARWIETLIADLGCEQTDDYEKQETHEEVWFSIHY